ncbi:MAG: hypothetical protein AAGF02_00845 [Actinomycetota bacterium]
MSEATETDTTETGPTETETTETEAEALDASDAEEEAAAPSRFPLDKVALVGAGVALVAIVVAAQRDIATQENLRGPRWMWHVIATTPPGVIIYGKLGPRGHPFGDLATPTVSKVVPPA